MYKNAFTRTKTNCFVHGLLFVVVSLGSALAQAIPIFVTVENLAPTDGNFLTPVWVGFHDGSFDLFDVGSPTSPELERLAEDGNTGPLSMSFASSGAGGVDATLFGPGGPLAPGESASMAFDLDGSDPSNRFFSYASMVIPSNDAFIANGDPMDHEIFDMAGLFIDTMFFVLGSEVLDAGTEVNDEVPANTAFLAQMMPDTGVVEGGNVGLHPGFLPGGNILSAFPGADFTAPGYQIARITISAVNAPEPGTLALLSLGILGIGFVRNRWDVGRERG